MSKKKTWTDEEKEIFLDKKVPKRIHDGLAGGRFFEAKPGVIRNLETGKLVFKVPWVVA